MTNRLVLIPACYLYLSSGNCGSLRGWWVIRTTDQKLTFAVRVNTLFRLGVRVLSAGVSFLLFRLLSPEDYGVVALGVGVVSLIFPFIASGVEVAYLRRGLHVFEKLSSILFFYLLVTLLLVLGLIVASICVPDFLNIPRNLLLPVQVLFFKVVFAAPMLCVRIGSQQVGRIDLLARGELISVGFSSALALALAFWGAGVWALVVQNLVLDLVMSVVVAYLIGWMPKFSFDPRFVLGLLRVGYLRGVDGMSFILRERMAKVLVGTFLGIRELGIYDIAHRLLMQVATIFLGASVDGIGTFFVKKKGAEVSENEGEKVINAFQSVSSLVSWVLVPMLLTAALFPFETFQSYTGKDFSSHSGFVVATCAYVALYTFEVILSKIGVFVSSLKRIWIRSLPVLVLSLLGTYFAVSEGVERLTWWMTTISLMNIFLMAMVLRVWKSFAFLGWLWIMGASCCIYVVARPSASNLLNKLMTLGIPQWVSLGIMSVLIMGLFFLTVSSPLLIFRLTSRIKQFRA